MKVAAASIAGFLRQLPPAIAGVLIYGADEGLVRERAGSLSSTILGGADDDPFRVVYLTPEQIRQDPARLGDETQSLSLMGGRRVIRIKEASDSLAPILQDVIARPHGDAVMIMEAGALEARSKLRVLCEAAPQLAVIACYPDGPREVAQLVRETLGSHRITVSDEAVSYLVDSLGSDRQITRRELEKLSLAVGDGGHVALEDAVASVGDTSQLVIDDLIYDAADGKLAETEAALTRLFREGEAPVTILRAALRHGQRLHLAAAKFEGGESADSIVRAIRPPIFFKLADRFKAQLQRWSMRRLQRYLTLISEAEASCKRTGFPEQTICRHALMQVTRLAAAKQRS